MYYESNCESIKSINSTEAELGYSNTCEYLIQIVHTCLQQYDVNLLSSYVLHDTFLAYFYSLASIVLKGSKQDAQVSKLGQELLKFHKHRKSFGKKSNFHELLLFADPMRNLYLLLKFNSNNIFKLNVTHEPTYLAENCSILSNEIEVDYFLESDIQIKAGKHSNPIQDAVTFLESLGGYDGYFDKSVRFEPSMTPRNIIISINSKSTETNETQDFRISERIQALRESIILPGKERIATDPDDSQHEPFNTDAKHSRNVQQDAKELTNFYEELFFPHLPSIHPDSTLLQSSHIERTSDLSLADPQGIHQQRDLAPNEICCHDVGTQSCPEGNYFSAIERRLASMVHLRSFPVNHKEMADAGLFYDEDSRVFRCYACSFDRPEHAWSTVDNPFHIHNTMSPGCPHLERIFNRKEPNVRTGNSVNRLPEMRESTETTDTLDLSGGKEVHNTEESEHPGFAQETTIATADNPEPRHRKPKLLQTTSKSVDSSAQCHQSDARNTRDRVMEDVTHSTDDNPHRLRVLSDLRSSYNQDSPRDSGFDEENIDSGELPGLPITSLDEREDSTELNRHNDVSHNSEGKPHGKRTAEE